MEKKVKREMLHLLYAGAVIGVVAVLLVLKGNPANMGLCIACFIRDIAGSFRLHNAAAVQYMRPEICGIVLGAFAMALINGEFKSRSGSCPLVRFCISFMVMLGALCFLGCPLRMVLRISAGDAWALFGLGGFVAGILVGCFFLVRGFDFGKSNMINRPAEAAVLPFVNLCLIVLAFAMPAIFAVSQNGPGAWHAPFAMSLVAGFVVGALAQRTRFCFAGSVRDVVLIKDWTLAVGLGSVLVSATIMNVVIGNFHFGFENQPVANTSMLWNVMGMFVVGLGSVMVGGCPLRQLVLAAEGNSDSSASVLGMFVGAAFAHNFRLVGNAVNSQPALEGKIAIACCIVLLLVIASCNTFRLRDGGVK